MRPKSTQNQEVTMEATDYIKLEEQWGANNYRPLDVVLSKGKGAWVWDTDGRKYLDCLSAYSAVNQGHCHPRILKAMLKQAEKLTLVSRAFRHDQLGEFYKEICELTHSHRVLPMNSGAEAVETAVKAVRKWGYEIKNVPYGKAEIIVCANNFHGRTLSVISFSTEDQYRDGYAPFTPGFITIPFGDIRALKNAITSNTVAFLVEPIQGEGGVIIPPNGFFRQARVLCDENNILMVLDEIQTGLGRTGKLFAEEHEDVEADLTIVGKALSGGFYPVSAVLSNQDALGVFKPGDHGSTFGGNPLACAVAREALKVLHEEGMIENSDRMGNYFIENLKKITSSHIKEVRGRGLLIGIELHPEAGGARRFCEALLNEGLLSKETHSHVLRIAPPLIIRQEEIDWALERLDKVLSSP